MRTDGTYNVFKASFSNQCTYWASERYHQLTGIWVPCTGNAYQWTSQAQQNGWLVGSTAPSVPSIICLQPYTQGAGSYGHVGIVESINSDGTYSTSNYDWYPHEGDSVKVNVTFRSGTGVSFIYASNNAGSQGIFTNASILTQNLAKTFSLASNASVATTLSTLDDLMEIKNPFDNLDTQTDTLSIAGVGVGSFTDPVSWLSSVGKHLAEDTLAITLRLIFILLGLYLLFRVVDHYLNITGTITNVVSTVGKVATIA